MEKALAESFEKTRLPMFLILAKLATDFKYFLDQHEVFQGKGNKL